MAYFLCSLFNFFFFYISSLSSIRIFLSFSSNNLVFSSNYFWKFLYSFFNFFKFSISSSVNSDFSRNGLGFLFVFSDNKIALYYFYFSTIYSNFFSVCYFLYFIFAKSVSEYYFFFARYGICKSIISYFFRWQINCVTVKFGNHIIFNVSEKALNFLLRRQFIKRQIFDLNFLLFFTH